MGKMIVISGASGVGKGTVLNLMMENRKDLTFSVSATTRPPRPGEVDGVHYYFVTRGTFEEMIQKGEFLEYDEHAKNYYGTPRAQALFLSCLLPWRNWSVGSGAGAIPRRTRSRSAWSGRSGKWSRRLGMTMWWSMTMPTAALKKF